MIRASAQKGSPVSVERVIGPPSAAGIRACLKRASHPWRGPYSTRPMPTGMAIRATRELRLPVAPL